MPTNIEIKARVRDTKQIHLLAERISDREPEIIEQLDTFFRTPRGRLKLREFSAQRAELIYYERPDQSGPKTSEYAIYPCTRPQALKHLLTASLGLRGVVRKTRTLYKSGQTRIHIDRVEGLGDFMELEVVMRTGQLPAEGERTARKLMEALQIAPGDLIEAAYIDLLEGSR